MHRVPLTLQPSGITVRPVTFTSAVWSCTQSMLVLIAGATHLSAMCVVVCQRIAMSLLPICPTVITVAWRHLRRSMTPMSTFVLQAGMFLHTVGCIPYICDD